MRDSTSVGPVLGWSCSEDIEGDWGVLADVVLGGKEGWAITGGNCRQVETMTTKKVV